jgi:poly(3-hydroxyoctanoate) depolymerase
MTNTPGIRRYLLSALLLAVPLAPACSADVTRTDASIQPQEEVTPNAPMDLWNPPDIAADIQADSRPDTLAEDSSSATDLGTEMLSDLAIDLLPDEATDSWSQDNLDAAPETASAPLCLIGPQNAACLHESTTLLTGISSIVPRDVHWQVPGGQPPIAGWPAVLLFQGSFLPAGHFWSTFLEAPFGIWHQVLLVESLLSSGFAVITPEAHFEGGTYWDTNIPPYSLLWETAPDHYFMLDILAHLKLGGFGPIDPARLYAAGFSSGGYMTSRMAVSYPGTFRALAIQSASYATCAAATCFVPELPPDHPPTLFLHGTKDTVVPLFTMTAYADKLALQETATGQVINADAGHEWFPTGPEAITKWFLSK